MLITITGPERYLVAQSLERHLSRIAPAGDAADFSVTRLEGARITPDDLTRAVQALGLFSEERVIVVDGLLSRFATKSDSDERPKQPSEGTQKRKSDPSLPEQFARCFESLPPSTTLILLERGSVAKNSTLLKAAQRYGKFEEHPTPRGPALERWISERCRVSEVKISNAAVSALAIGLPDLESLSNELDKLAIYVGVGGLIDEDVLRKLSYVTKQDDVFELTSSAARRDIRSALRQLHLLINGGTSPEGILPVLAWQVRTLIQIRDLLDRRVPEAQMAGRSGISDFVVRKSLGQARQFTMQKLLETHANLLELDHAVKTGRADALMSLDTLIVKMCG